MPALGSVVYGGGASSSDGADGTAVLPGDDCDVSMNCFAFALALCKFDAAILCCFAITKLIVIHFYVGVIQNNLLYPDGFATFLFASSFSSFNLEQCSEIKLCAILACTCTVM